MTILDSYVSVSEKVVLQVSGPNVSTITISRETPMEDTRSVTRFLKHNVIQFTHLSKLEVLTLFGEMSTPLIPSSNLFDGLKSVDPSPSRP